MLEPREVAQRLLALVPAASVYWVAFSGGRDSSVLLHALAGVRASLPGPLAALHVEHGLHADAPKWSAHCRQLCATLEVPFTVRRVAVDTAGSSGVEAAARRARYAAFRRVVAPGECLILAHHADDQAETFLLRALRGSGLTGLSAIPPCRALGRAVLARPLLARTGAELDAYARYHELAWIDDPANADPIFDRVYLRRRVVPRLASRWPTCGRRLSASARALHADRSLLAAYLDTDLRRVRSGGGLPTVAALLEWDEHRRCAVVRRWLECAGARPPPRRRLINGLQALLTAGPSANPELVWADGTLRRYRGRLYFLARREGEPTASVGADTTAPDGSALAAWSWQGDSDLLLPGGTLHAVLTPASGLDPDHRGQDLEVRFASAAHRGEARRLARLFQQLAVPPWMRAQLPIVYHLGRPIAVAGYGSCRRESARPGLRLLWLPHPAHSSPANSTCSPWTSAGG